MGHGFRVHHVKLKIGLLKVTKSSHLDPHLESE